MPAGGQAWRPGNPDGGAPSASFTTFSRLADSAASWAPTSSLRVKTIGLPPLTGTAVIVAGGT
jgi:hypothetical protein